MKSKNDYSSLRRLGAFAAGVAVGLGLVTTPAYAAYPDSDMHMIIPFGPGGGSDTLARTIVSVIDELKLVPVKIISENRSGGSGAKGYTYVGKMAGDQYNMATVSVSFFTTPLLGGSQVSYRDFTPIAAISTAPYVLVVPKSSGINSLDDLKKAGRLTTGTVGVVSDPVLLAKMTSKALKIQIDPVPFDGEGEVIAALLGGHVSLGFMNPSEALSQVSSGKMTALAVSSAVRSAAFPNVPTFKELGHDIVHTQLRGVVMPRNIPKNVVAYWEGVMEKVAKSDAWKTKYIERFHDIPTFENAETYAKTIEATNLRYQTLMKELGIIK